MVAPGQTKAQIQPLMMVHQVYSRFFYQPTQRQEWKELERGHSFVLALVTPTGC